jgi:hypothetical protein
VSIIQLLANAGPRPSADPDAAYLKVALPLNTWAEFNDQSPLIRGSGSATSVTNYYDSGAANAQTIQSSIYKFYGSAAQKPIGANDNVFRESHIDLDLGSGNALGAGDFCMEFWFYTDSFAVPTGATRRGLLFPPWQNNLNADGYIPYIVIDGTQIRVRNTEETTTYITSSGLSTGTWYHVALTRSSGTLRLFVNGVLQGSASVATNWTGYKYFFFDTIRWYQNPFCMQDLRVYVGTPKYTSNFTPPGAMFI